MVEIEAKPEEITFFKRKCHDAMESINWNCNTPLLPNLTTIEALVMARAGDMFNKTTVELLEPQDGEYNEWMNFVHLLTILYNRNRTYKKYTILRTGCY